MKRSELISDLATAIIMFDHSINYKVAQELADICLRNSEEAGMLAPMRVPELTPYGEPNGLSIGEYTWEPEDV